MAALDIKQRGLTLIELMVTIAIVAILAGIAIPSYERYTTSANRTAAKTALLTLRGKMENYYINNKTYTTDMTNLGYSASPSFIDKSGEAVAAGASTYSVTITNPGGCTTANCYVITAAPQNAQATNDTDCVNMTVTLLGAKNASGPKGVTCWN